jgi:UDP-N-acetylglucosamine 2-epimerase (non-hydrolysing)
MERSVTQSGMTTVVVVIGTRPEAIKLAPVIWELDASDHSQPIVVKTGQHDDMVDRILDLAGIAPDFDLEVDGSGPNGLSGLASQVMDRTDGLLEMLTAPPVGDPVSSGLLVLVQGDTSSSMAAAMAGFHRRIPVVHVEAGLRTSRRGSPFPEEMNREVISLLSCLHLAPTEANACNLVKEGVDGDVIFVTGNTGIDALFRFANSEAPFADTGVGELVDRGGDLVLVTAHRRENWDGGLAGVADGVGRLAASFPEVSFVVPVHPNPLIRRELGDRLEPLSNVSVVPALDYPDLARLMAASKLVITDSGGIQEEAPALGRPVLVTRGHTERIEGQAAGTVKVVGTDPDAIEREASLLLTDDDQWSRMSETTNPYGDGRAAGRVVDAIAFLLGKGPAPEPFRGGATRNGIVGYADRLGIPLPARD